MIDENEEEYYDEGPETSNERNAHNQQESFEEDPTGEAEEDEDLFKLSHFLTKRNQNSVESTKRIKSNTQSSKNSTAGQQTEAQMHN